MAFPLIMQEQPLWCWAAVTTAIEKFFDPATTVTQCEVADRLLGLGCCGNKPACNSAQRLDDALGPRLNAKLPFRLTFTDLAAQLDANFPVCVRIGWFGGGGHFVTISRCRVAGGQRLVVVEDPLFGTSTVRYEHFISAYKAGDVAGGGGEWTHTYLVQ